MKAFDGETFDPSKDERRLKTALYKVWDLMKDGEWRTLQEIARYAGCSEAGASARLRDFRKAKFQEIYPVKAVESARVADSDGRWVYRLILREPGDELPDRPGDFVELVQCVFWDEEVK